MASPERIPSLSIPLVIPLADKIQNLYEACMSHCNSWKSMRAGAKQDQNLQNCIKEFRESYGVAWNKLDSWVKMPDSE